MYGQMAIISRLKSKISFLNASYALKKDPFQSIINAQKDKTEGIRDWIKHSEHLPTGYELQWRVWKTLNRLRVGVGRSKSNMVKLRYISDQNTSCHCETIQTMAHQLICLLAPRTCTLEDLITANQITRDVAQHRVNEKIQSKYLPYHILLFYLYLSLNLLSNIIVFQLSMYILNSEPVI